MKTTYFKYLIAFLIISQISLASNRDDSNNIFPSKTESTGMEQFIISAVEYILFNKIHASWVGVVPLNDVMIDFNTDQIEKIQKVMPKVEKVKIKEKLKERILKLEDGITQRRINAILAAEKAGKMSNLIHNITFVGQALILVDLTGRAYVWFKLDRDPTISPVATFVRKSLQ